MQKREHIVVGFDESEASRSAVREAARLAGSNNADLLILEAIQDELIAEVERETGVDGEDILAARRHRLNHQVEDILSPEPAGSRVQTNVVMGHPFAELIGSCREKNASLLVLGATGMTGLAHSSIGSVARSAVRHAPCDTMLVRPGIDEGFKKVICGVDFSATSAEALRSAATIAKADGARLVLVAVHTPAWLRYAREYGGDLDIPEELSDDYSNQLTTELADFVSEHIDDTEGVDFDIVSLEAVSPAVGLCDYANQFGADLVVIGTKGLGIGDVRPLGSTAEHVISGAHCSVLSIRPDTA